MNPILYIIRLYLFSLLVLFLNRIFLFIFHHDYFGGLDTKEIIDAFLMGTRIDVISLNTFTGLLILLLLTPLSTHRKYKKTITTTWFVILAIMTTIDIVDTVYFGFFHKHLDLGLVLMNNDITPILYFVKSYLWQVLLLAAYIFLLFVVWKKISDVEVFPEKGRTYIWQFLIVSIFIFLGARGFKLTGKSFGIADAFSGDKLKTAHLSLSGFFTIYRNGQTKIENINTLERSKALNVLHTLLNSKSTTFIDEKFPLKRRLNLNTDESKPFNYVIIMVESLSARFVDSFNGSLGLKATPYIDKLASESLKFDNAYANGRQSIAGITALFCGLVPPAGTSLYLGKGLENVRLSYLGTLLKQNGYDTLAMQSSKRRSFRIDAIARLAGFKHYFGSEDFDKNLHGENPTRHPAFGSWDGDMFDRFFKEIQKLKEPFLAFTFTSTTHFPYILPSKRYELYPHDPKSLNGFLNTLRYTDEMIKEFLEKSKNQPWFDHTIFIIMADHTAPMPDETVKRFEKEQGVKFPTGKMERYHIPILFYAPKIFKPKINHTLISQASIFPTILGLSKITYPFSTLSNPALEQDFHPFVITKEGERYGICIENGCETGSLDHFVKQKRKETSKVLLSIFQIYNELYSINRIY